MDGSCEVLVVEDDALLGEQIVRRLSSSGHRATLRSNPVDVLDQLAAGADWDVVLLDIGLPNVSGIDVLLRFRERQSLASVIMLTGDDTASTATACMRAGAFHYLTKPFEPMRLTSLITSAARYTKLRRQLAVTSPVETRMVGSSPQIKGLRDLVERIGAQDVTVLVQGESGTGKERVARMLHERGRRASKPFVALNCGAIPPSLIDSELFGHVKGAFTGATADRAGVFVEAHGGTLFLDEIGDMPIEVQARLLRVLQEGEVRAVGRSDVRTVDVRVIAATHIDIAQAVKAGRFREDLYYRLSVVVVPIHPLRERIDDLPLLAAHFLRKHGGKQPPALSIDALETMMEYAWPGNVRELENAIVFALAMRRGPEIGIDALPPTLLRRRTPEVAPDIDETLPLMEAKRQAVAAYERKYVERVLALAGGSIAEAARRAGLDRANFRRLMLRHRIDPAAFR
jgi:DNA-binding NtrC family response regulator